MDYLDFKSTQFLDEKLSLREWASALWSSRAQDENWKLCSDVQPSTPPSTLCQISTPQLRHCALLFSKPAGACAHPFILHPLYIFITRRTWWNFTGWWEHKNISWGRRRLWAALPTVGVVRGHRVPSPVAPTFDSYPQTQVRVSPLPQGPLAASLNVISPSSNPPDVLQTTHAALPLQRDALAEHSSHLGAWAPPPSSHPESPGSRLFQSATKAETSELICKPFQDDKA